MSTTGRAITGAGVMIIIGGLMCLSFQWGRGSAGPALPFGGWSVSAYAAPEHPAPSAPIQAVRTPAAVPSGAAAHPATIERNSPQSPAPSPPPAPSLPAPAGPQVVMGPSIVIKQSNIVQQSTIQQNSGYPARMTAKVTHFVRPDTAPDTVSIPQKSDEPLAGGAMETIHLPNGTIFSVPAFHNSSHVSASRSRKGSIDISVTRRDPETGKLTTTTRHIESSP